MSRRFSTRARSRSSDSSAVARSSARSSAVNGTSLRRLLTAAVADASGVRRSWLTALSRAVRNRSTSASAAGRAACSASRSCRRATAACAANASTTRRSSASSGVPAQHEGHGVVHAHLGIAVARGARGGAAHGGGGAPLVAVGTAHPLQEGDVVEPEGLAQLLEQRVQGPVPAQHAAGERRQGRGLGAGSRGLPGPPRREVDDAAHGDGHQEERQQREDVLARGDGEPVQRLREPVVEQEERDDGRAQRRREPADQRHGDDRDEEGEDVGRQRDVLLDRQQQHGEQRQPDDGEGEPRPAAPGGEAALPRPGRSRGAPLGHLLVRYQVDVEGTRRRGRRRADTRREQLGETAASAGPEHELGRGGRARELQQRAGHVGPDDEVVGAAELLDQ